MMKNALLRLTVGLILGSAVLGVKATSAERTFARNCTEPVANRKDRLFKRFEQRHVPLRLSTKRPRLPTVWLERKTWIEIPRLG